MIIEAAEDPSPFLILIGLKLHFLRERTSGRMGIDLKHRQRRAIDIEHEVLAGFLIGRDADQVEIADPLIDFAADPGRVIAIEILGVEDADIFSGIGAAGDGQCTGQSVHITANVGAQFGVVSRQKHPSGLRRLP